MAGNMKVGVLALQGDVSEHVVTMECAFRSSGISGEVVEVRRPAQLDGISALLMPGGESTTMAKQIERFGLRQPILDLGRSGLPIMGTCAGAILLASDIMDQRGPREVCPLGLIEIDIRRNAFGRQADSFEKPLTIKGLDGDFPGIFIRAPRIEEITEKVESLASLDAEHVMVRQGSIVALTFHPELAGDDRVHGLFLKMVRP